MIISHTYLLKSCTRIKCTILANSVNMSGHNCLILSLKASIPHFEIKLVTSLEATCDIIKSLGKTLASNCL